MKEAEEKLRNARKELSALERKIGDRDAQRNTLRERLLSTRDPLIAEKAHAELAQIEQEISTLEEQWLELDAQTQETAGE